MEQALRACTLTLEQRACVDIDSPAAPSAPMRARITWLDGLSSSVLLEVRALGAEETEPHLQRLDFGPSDPVDERWKAIGLAIGTLADPEAAASGATSTDEGEDGESTSDHRPLWLGAHAILGSGFRGKGNATGAGVQVAYAPRYLPLFSKVAVSSRLATKGAITAEWRELEVGIGAHASVGTVSLRATTEVVAQQLGVQAFNERTGRTDGGSQLLLGFGLGAEVAWPSDGQGGLLLGGRVVRLRHPTVVRLAGEEAAENPNQAATGYLGLEVRF